MTYTLESEELLIRISGTGAELCSLYSKKFGLEYLWQADKHVWPRHAPVLFPIVGKLRNDRFTYAGKSYTLGQHGFARDREFVLTGSPGNTLHLELCADEETLQKFPFHFRLRITYTLEASTLFVSYNVYNPSNERIFFSVGAHPGFSTRNYVLSDFFIEFEQEENCRRWFVEGGLIGKQSADFNHRRLDLSADLFDADALVFRQLRSSSAKLLCKHDAHGLELSWDENFSHFGIWTKKGSNNFVCLEPWAGVADAVDASGELTEKEGIVCLMPGEEKDFRMRYLFF